MIRDGDTVVARTNLGRERRVVIAGHLDTVPINDNLPTRFETIDGERYLWGRGTVDMKGGVAVQLKLALSSPTHRRPHVDVVRPRGGLGGAERPRAPRAHRPDSSRATSRSSASRRTAGRGRMQREPPLRAARLRAAARTRPQLGRRQRDPQARAGARPAGGHEAETIEVDGLAYREGLNAVGVTGGVAGNVIPDEAMLHVNYRFAPNRSVAEAIEFARAMFPEYELTVVDAAEGARLGLDAPLAQQFVHAVGAEARPKYGWTDVARFSALGIPAVNFGPGDPLKAHADDERRATRSSPASARSAPGSPARPEGGRMTSAPIERSATRSASRSSPRVRWRLLPWWAKVALVYAAARAVTTVLVLVLASAQGANPTAARPGYFEYANMWDARWYQIIARRVPRRPAVDRRRPGRRERLGVPPRVSGPGRRADVAGRAAERRVGRSPSPRTGAALVFHRLMSRFLEPDRASSRSCSSASPRCRRSCSSATRSRSDSCGWRSRSCCSSNAGTRGSSR